jgi:hypothetical protein
VSLMFVAVLLTGMGTSVGQVSYVSVDISPGFNLLANPLSGGFTNGANEIMPIIDGEEILTWNGASFNGVIYDSTANGWVQLDDITPAQPPSLPPGKGFVFFNPVAAATNFIFTGRVVPAPGTTNAIDLPSGYSLVGSLLPATVTNITSAPVNLPIINGMQILTWTGWAYDYFSYDSGFGGWIGPNFMSNAPPSYKVGQGFFLFNPGPPRIWEQSSP